eukprot:TRINITY_DN1843_c0_g2_i2.p1 TRINITY_DN1843_c0_g2~~TRINITY_DN1843_c0_g2_i2.p1  ORF type:complete len:879 (+),score=354.05 TRINITY_DN1843_c0_g2_i2:194-2830(+)
MAEPPAWAADCSAEAYCGSVAEWAAGAPTAAVVSAAAELLDVFVAFNFTGPLTDEEVSARPLARAVAAIGSDQQRQAQASLTVDGEPAVRGLTYPGLLTAALAALRAAKDEPAALLWRCRAQFVHQRVLVNLSHTLRQSILDCLDRLAGSAGTGSGVEEIPPASELQLVRGLVHYHYREPHLSCDALEKAREESSMQVQLTSMLGVRTQHQVFETAQLMLRARSAAPPAREEGEATAMPRVVTGVLVGSNVLDRPRTLAENVTAGSITEEQAQKAMQARARDQERMSSLLHLPVPEEVPAEEPAAAEVVDGPLSEADQALLLGLCMNVSNKNPMHGLTNAEMLPYLERLMMEGQTSWLVKSQTLLLRSRLETARARVQERSLMQVTELVDQFAVPHGLQDGDVKETALAHRTRSFWRLLWPPIHSLKKELCKRYMDVHMFKTALETAESIEAWPQVIRCCAKLGKKNKAEGILRALIAETPEDPWLWSSLGDATRPQRQEDPTAPAPGDTEVSIASYMKAWELSEGKLTAAMRGLGELYLDLERFEEAVRCFDRTTQLNPMYGVRWFKHGWALLKTENWERAAHCYTRSVQIDIEDGFSWSNLALCNLKLERKVPAFHCLRQAKKWSLANWRVWDNLLTVAVEVGEFREAMRVLDDILELRGRSYPLKPDVLRMLVDGVARRVVEGDAPAAEAHADPEADDLPDEGEPAVSPLCSDFVLPEILRAAGEKGRKAEENERRDLAARESLRQDMGRLLGKICGLVTQDADVWASAATFHERTGSALDAFDARVKEVRCSTSDKSWRQTKSRALDVLRRTEQMVRAAMSVCPKTLAERKVQTTAPKTQASMQADSILSVTREHFGGTPEFAALEAAAKEMDA